MNLQGCCAIREKKEASTPSDCRISFLLHSKTSAAAGKFCPQGDIHLTGRLIVKIDKSANLTIASSSARRRCGVQWSSPSALSAFYPPLMDPVMDRASEGFKDGQAAHLLKSIPWQASTKHYSSAASKWCGSDWGHLLLLGIVHVWDPQSNK